MWWTVLWGEPPDQSRENTLRCGGLSLWKKFSNFIEQRQLSLGSQMQFTPMMCPLFPVNATWYAVSAGGTVSSMARLTMEMFTWVRTNYWIPRHHAAGMKNLQRKRRIQTRSSCMGVAYAVNHFQRRKKQCIASTVTDRSNFECVTFN